MNYSETSNPVSPSDVDLREFTLGQNTTLIWPFSGLNGINTCARVMVVTASTAGLNLKLPPADEGSLGYTTIIMNVGVNSFNLNDNSDNNIGVVDVGQVQIMVLRTQLTSAGTWLNYTLGATTSAANAAMLAGLGLKAIAGTLNSDSPANVFSDSQNVGISSRAQFNLWVGGAGVVSFDPASNLGNGWWTSFRNGGTGALSLSPVNPDQIDDQPSEILNPGDSCLVFCTGVEFYSVGIGRTLSVTDSQSNINASGGVDIVLDPTEYANNILNFTGALTANINIIFPTFVKNYFVRNNTTGLFSLTTKTALGTGVVIPQGGASIITSDGTNVDAANTSSGGTVTSITAGAGLQGGTISGAGTIAMAPTGVAPGNYGDANNFPVLSVNSFGEVVTIATSPAIPTGVEVAYWGSAAPAGWVLESGLTIGNAASNATNRANADTVNLFTLLWNSTTSTELPIFSSTGVVAARGVSAAADYAVNKALAVPDARGRVTAGKDDMGGTAANRITNTNGVVGITLGSAGGEQTHTLIIAEIPSHGHTNSVSDGGHSHTFIITQMGGDSTFGNYVDQSGAGGTPSIQFSTDAAVTGISVTINNTGGGGSHNNLQPTIIANKIIKL